LRKKEILGIAITDIPKSAKSCGAKEGWDEEFGFYRIFYVGKLPRDWRESYRKATHKRRFEITSALLAETFFKDRRLKK